MRTPLKTSRPKTPAARVATAATAATALLMLGACRDRTPPLPHDVTDPPATRAAAPSPATEIPPMPSAGGAVPSTPVGASRRAPSPNGQPATAAAAPRP